MIEKVDCVVIGANAVGLVIAGRMAIDAREASFYEAIHRYYHGLRDGKLQPGYTVIPPRITGPGEPLQNFTFSGSRDHDIPELVKLFGIESPGLTSSPAIADHVAGILE